MRQSTRSALVLITLAVLSLVVLPLVVMAQDGQPSYVGTYQGSATGSGSRIGGGDGGGGGSGGSGGGKSVAIKVWAEDLGDQTKLTFQVQRFKVTVDAVGDEIPLEGGGARVPFAIQKMGVDATGEVTMQSSGGAWQLSGSATGEALGYRGTGRAGCTRTSSSVQLPGIGEQITGMISGLFGGGDEDDAGTSDGDAAAGGSGDAEQPEEGDAGGPTGESPVAPAEPQPPVSTDDALVAIGLMVLLLFIEIMLA